MAAPLPVQPCTALCNHSGAVTVLEHARLLDYRAISAAVRIETLLAYCTHLVRKAT